jgi:hypothetical protein
MSILLPLLRVEKGDGEYVLYDQQTTTKLYGCYEWWWCFLLVRRRDLLPIYSEAFRGSKLLRCGVEMKQDRGF